MTKEQKLALMKERIKVLSENGKQNEAICKKITREVRKMEKEQ